MNALGQTASDSFSDRSKQKSCSNCGLKFTCGPTSGAHGCWCEALPHVALVAGADQDCLCPSCLSAAIAQQAEASVARQSIRSNPLPALTEGEDYYCEGAAIVFTAHYLLKRGYCCDSGCRHCPYE